jgi:hypothetical protein
MRMSVTLAVMVVMRMRARMLMVLVIIVMMTSSWLLLTLFDVSEALSVLADAIYPGFFQSSTYLHVAYASF